MTDIINIVLQVLIYIAFTVLVTILSHEIAKLKFEKEVSP